MLLVFRGLWNDGASASMYREIMFRNKSIFQISTLICLSSISICNLLIDLPTYIPQTEGRGPSLTMESLVRILWSLPPFRVSSTPWQILKLSLAS
jgi:hypothetical protein